MSPRKQPAPKWPGTQRLAADGRTVVRAGPRNGQPPWGPEVSLRVTHRTLGNGVGALFRREEFEQLAAWLADDTACETEALSKYVRSTSADGVPYYVREIAFTRSEFRLIDLQTQLIVSKKIGERYDWDSGGYGDAPTGALKITASWLGSGRSRSAVLGPVDGRAFTKWAIEWKGWEDDTSEA